MFIMKTLGLRGRTSSGQTILILLVESGLVYLGIQVSHFESCLLACARKILRVFVDLIDRLLGFDFGQKCLEPPRSCLSDGASFGK